MSNRQIHPTPYPEVNAALSMFLTEVQAALGSHFVGLYVHGSLAFYNPVKKGWVAEPGEFEVLAGASSRDIRLKAAFTLE
jgi:hypothetical protein